MLSVITWQLWKSDSSPPQNLQLLPEGCCFPFLRPLSPTVLARPVFLAVCSHCLFWPLFSGVSVCDLAQSSITAEVQQHRLPSSTLLGVVPDNSPKTVDSDSFPQLNRCFHGETAPHSITFCHAQLRLTLSTLWTVALRVPLSVGLFQGRILEWAVISYAQGSSQPRD